MTRPPHPIISDGNQQKAPGGIQVSKRTEEAVRAIFEKTLQENQGNQGQVGKKKKLKTFSGMPIKPVLWQPHDFRLYIDFSKVGFNPKKPSNQGLKKYKTMVPIFTPAYTYSALNYGKEHLYKNFCGCTIRVKKNQIEITNNTHRKQWRRIERDSHKEIVDRISEIMRELETFSLKVVEMFIDIHGGHSNFKILNSRCEHGIHGDDYLDKVPAEFVVNDTVFKKLYSRKVEFKDVSSLKNFVTNRALEDFSPAIVEKLDLILEKFDEQKEVEPDLFKFLQDNDLLEAFNEAYFNGSQKEFIENVCGIDLNSPKASQTTTKDWACGVCSKLFFTNLEASRCLNSHGKIAGRIL